MAFDVKQYAEELFKAAGVSDDTVKQAVLTVLGNDAVSKRLGDDVLRQSDYSRNMDALRKKEADTMTYYQSLLGWEQDVKANAERLAAYEAKFGKLDGNGQPPVVQTVQGDFLSKSEFEAELDKRSKARDAQFISLMKDVGRISSAHAVEFKEALDVDALEKIAMEKNLPLRQAYEEFVRPRREERSVEARKHELQQAREEGARDALSKHHLPIDSQKPEFHPFFNPGDPKQQIEYTSKDGRLSPVAERQLRNNFVDEWNKAGQATSDR